MNKIAIKNKAIVSQLNMGTLFIRENHAGQRDFYILAKAQHDPCTPAKFILVSLKNGNMWTYPKDMEDCLQTIEQNNFVKFEGTIILTTE